MSQHGVMGFIRDAAQRIRGEDHSVACINCVHDSCQDADIRFPARDYECIGLKSSRATRKKVGSLNGE